MRRPAAVAGSLLFLLVAPGLVVGVLPYWITGWRAAPWWPPVRVAGGLLLAAGLAVLLRAFARFVAEGAGTPSPAAPTEKLVVGGLYRWVRNPMYLAVVAAVAGQALLLGRPVLLAYGAAVAGAQALFVHGYEEPALRARYGADYDAYRRAVPAWLPRRPRQ